MNTELLVSNEENCSGCGACQNICPRSAISLVENQDGFVYPQIEDDKCIQCNQCANVCPLQNGTARNAPFYAYAATTDEATTSASGGVASALERAVLQDGGVAFGSVMEFRDGVPSVHHACIEKETELPALKGSKYVQSSTSGTFKEVRDLLSTGKNVIYTGTPCQIAGLRNYLRKDYSNLLLVDLVCHGVPNQKTFQDYIHSLTTDKRTVTQFKFRDKTYGWGHVGSITINDKTRPVHSEESPFFCLFLKGELLRPSCYKCQFSNMKRTGDITVGDYWGIELQHPELLKANSGPIRSEEGCSCVLVNTEKGQKWLAKYGNTCSLYKSIPERVQKYNGCLNRPTPCGKHREELFNRYRNEGYSAVEGIYKQYYSPNLISRVKLHTPNSIKRIYQKLKEKERRITHYGKSNT